MSEYEKLMKNLMNKRSLANKKVDREILNLYQSMYKDYIKELSKVKPGSLKEMWLNTQMKALGEEMKYIGKQYEGVLTKEMESIINSTLKTQENYFNTAAEKNGLPKDLFDNTFTKMNSKVLREVMSGNLYKDGRGLSSRIWKDGKQFNHDIDYVIKQGIAKKRSIYDIAKDLEKYVKPGERKDYEWKKLYPNAGKKVVDYNAYRLANTSISHAYQTALARVNRQNPFMEGIEWRGGNHARSCELCKERNGKVYGAKETKGRFTIDPLPLDHPNGFCENIPIVEDLEAVGDRIHNWINGKGDKELDKWFDKWGDQYKGPNDIKKSQDYKEKPTKASRNDPDYIKSKYGIDVRYDGVKEKMKDYPKEMSRAMNMYMDDLFSKYPGLVHKDYKLSFLEYYFDEDADEAASYSGPGNLMRVNIATIWNRITDFGEHAAKYNIADDSAAFAKELQVFIHEFGHYVDYSTTRAVKKYGTGRDEDGAYKSFISSGDVISQKELKKYLKSEGWKLTKKEITKELDSYAATDIREMVAEGWGYTQIKEFIGKDWNMYNATKNYADSKLGKDIVKYYKDLLEKNFK